MGFIRGSLLVIVCILLFIVLLLSGIFLTLSLSLKYENVQEGLVSVTKGLTDDKFGLIEEGFNLTERMNEAREFMREHCQNETSYVFAGGGYTFVLPCYILEELDENPRALIDQGMENIVEQVYYDDYNCKFWNCFQETGFLFF